MRMSEEDFREMITLMNNEDHNPLTSFIECTDQTLRSLADFLISERIAYLEMEHKYLIEKGRVELMEEYTK